MKQRGVELTEGQIAGPAEDDEIEWFDLYIAYGHEASLWIVEKWWALGWSVPVRTVKAYRS